MLRGRSAAEPCEQERSGPFLPLAPVRALGWPGGLLNAGGDVGLVRLHLRAPGSQSKGAGMNFSVVSSCGCAFALVLLDRFKLQFRAM